MNLKIFYILPSPKEHKQPQQPKLQIILPKIKYRVKEPLEFVNLKATQELYNIIQVIAYSYTIYLNNC